jgi:hypothetical protein
MGRDDHILGSALRSPTSARTDLLFRIEDARLTAASLDSRVLSYLLEMAALEAGKMGRGRGFAKKL